MIRLGFKTLAIGVLLVVFGVVFAVIGAIRGDRERYRAQVVREVSASTAGPQTLAGPVLVVPFRYRVETRSVDSTGRRVTTSYRTETGQVVVLPESLEIRAGVSVETRSRGIHEARVFDASLEVAATFAPPGAEAVRDYDIVEWLPAWLSVGVGDTRGMHRTPEVAWNGRAVTSRPGDRTGMLGEGFSAETEPWSALDGARSSATVRLRLAGTERVGFVPVGKETDVRMTSAWPHPSFTGRMLPTERTLKPDGFTATWHTSQFATGGDLAVLMNASGPQSAGRDFGVSFIEPVDVYRLSDRAVKYGMMFVLLTFVGFFLIEVLRRLDIHPIQYGLVGFALAAFFLLLLSLSEHLPFALAYWIGSAACVGLIVHYLAHVLRGGKRALGFGAGLVALYGLLYVVLRSEDYALLLGTLVVFGVLAFVMVATRRVDWNRIGQAPEA